MNKQLIGSSTEHSPLDRVSVKHFPIQQKGSSCMLQFITYLLPLSYFLQPLNGCDRHNNSSPVYILRVPTLLKRQILPTIYAQVAHLPSFDLESNSIT